MNIVKVGGSVVILFDIVTYKKIKKNYISIRQKNSENVLFKGL